MTPPHVENRITLEMFFFIHITCRSTKIIKLFIFLFSQIPKFSLDFGTDDGQHPLNIYEL